MARGFAPKAEGTAILLIYLRRGRFRDTGPSARTSHRHLGFPRLRTHALAAPILARPREARSLGPTKLHYASQPSHLISRSRPAGHTLPVT
ncbi:hypothetical protein CORC01_06728 [Colletotrichum orchidophilum]|uniref:Uncharacterized protein n=1 Tax=Colletotrichum orchidophilum TaxID=1209926 RepID=A0A1G4B981_9PEZI|nr:uncharacterized protein CORC01_06728 [Colletotrichum orchidophilum]OHE97865.1 hypothetical protein CORC01_06728 [Colletotrichum orchidophilum]